MEVAIQANPKPIVVSRNTSMKITTLKISQTSQSIYTFVIEKTFVSAQDFQKYQIIIGNNQGNVSINIEAIEASFYTENS